LATLEDIKTRSIKSGANQTVNPSKGGTELSASETQNLTREPTTTSEGRRSRSVLVWTICGVVVLLGAFATLFCWRSPRRKLL
jgi:hypothetical protein